MSGADATAWLVGEYLYLRTVHPLLSPGLDRSTGRTRQRSGISAQAGFQPSPFRRWALRPGGGDTAVMFRTPAFNRRFAKPCYKGWRGCTHSACAGGGHPALDCRMQSQ